MTTSSTFFTILLRQIVDVVVEYVECVLQEARVFKFGWPRWRKNYSEKRNYWSRNGGKWNVQREVASSNWWWLGRNATTTRAATTTIGECIYITAAAAASPWWKRHSKDIQCTNTTTEKQRTSSLDIAHEGLTLNLIFKINWRQYTRNIQIYIAVSYGL